MDIFITQTPKSHGDKRKKQYILTRVQMERASSTTQPVPFPSSSLADQLALGIKILSLYLASEGVG